MRGDFREVGDHKLPESDLAIATAVLATLVFLAFLAAAAPAAAALPTILAAAAATLSAFVVRPHDQDRLGPILSRCLLRRFPVNTRSLNCTSNVNNKASRHVFGIVAGLAGARRIRKEGFPRFSRLNEGGGIAGSLGRANSLTKPTIALINCVVVEVSVQVSLSKVFNLWVSTRHEYKAE